MKTTFKNIGIQFNQCLNYGNSHDEERSTGLENTNDTIAENLSSQEKDMGTQIQGAHRNPYTCN